MAILSLGKQETEREKTKVSAAPSVNGPLGSQRWPLSCPSCQTLRENSPPAQDRGLESVGSPLPPRGSPLPGSAPGAGTPRPHRPPAHSEAATPHPVLLALRGQIKSEVGSTSETARFRHSAPPGRNFPFKKKKHFQANVSIPPALSSS